MQDKLVDGSGAQPTAPADKPFQAPLHYPGDPPAPTPAPARAANSPGGRRLFTRVILPLILFVVVVAGTAWVTQYLPSWRKPRVLPVLAPGTALLKFDQRKAVWDEKDPNFAEEFEFGSEGSYDFPFTNPNPVPVQMGVSFTSCGCTRVDVGILSPSEIAAYQKDKKKGRWQVLDTRGISVPAGAAGVVRVIWKVRNTGILKNLTVKLWSQTAGRPRDEDITLEASVAFVTGIRYSPHIKNFGNLAPHAVERAEFLFWSSTRDHFDLDVKEKKENPCFVFKAKPVSPDEFGAVRNMLKTDHGIDTHIKAAYQVTVEVHAQRGGQHLDQGPFERNVPMIVDHNETDESPGPVLKGWVRGDIVVGNPEDGGKVDLKNFPATAGRERRLSLTTAAEVKLVPDKVPDYLEVQVTAKNTANGNTSWELRVAVKPRVLQPGPLPEDSAIILRTNSMPPRRIRIPVLGNAVQG